MNSSETQNHNTTRFAEIDVAKGIGILLVIFAHAVLTNSVISTLIYSFHMPLFFIISGMMFNKIKYPKFKQFVLRRLKTLICPYILFSIISVIPFCIFKIYPQYKDFIKFIIESFKLFTQILIAQSSLTVPYNNPLWFVPCLFILEIICFFIFKIKNKWIQELIIILLVFLGWFTQSSLCPIDFSFLPWNLSTACFSIGFYYIGNIAFPYLKNTFTNNANSQHKKIKLIITSILSIGVLIPVSLLNGEISLGSQILNNGLLLYITGIAGTIFILCISCFLRNIKPLAYLGKTSFYMMSVHKLYQVYLINIFELLAPFIFKMSFSFDLNSWSQSLALFVSVFFLSILTVLIYNKKIKPVIIKIEQKHCSNNMF